MILPGFGARLCLTKEGPPQQIELARSFYFPIRANGVVKVS